MCQKFQETEFVDEKRTCIASMKLRYFTPFEVALLMGFPDHFRKLHGQKSLVTLKIVNEMYVKLALRFRLSLQHVEQDMLAPCRKQLERQNYIGCIEKLFITC